MAIPVYAGRFGTGEAERLLWRAGFGPRRGEASSLAKLGLQDAVRSLTNPRAEKFTGPPPRDEKGHPLAPADAWGHEHLWWLDRMVRTRRPLVERMTLVWHDWFATSRSGVSSQRLMINQNETLRAHSLGSFQKLLLAVTSDPAMLVWLSGVDNRADAPNENYARELMELFTLGEGNGYSEQDVREQARALTGWLNQWSEAKGPHDFRFERKRWDSRQKLIFGRRGTFDWRDACNLCLQHPLHAPFLVGKLWSYFVPVAPDAETKAQLESLYRESYEVRPVLEAILKHPALHTGPRMVKPPVVFLAGLLRGLGRGIDTSEWVWLSEGAGQRLFMPPSVAGWNDERWLDTATFRGRWWVANEALSPYALLEKQGQPPPRAPSDADAIVAGAINLLGNPTIRRETIGALTRFAHTALGKATSEKQRQNYAPLVVNSVRQLLAMSPDYQTS